MPLPSQSSRAGLGGPSRGSVYRGGRRRRRGGGVPVGVKAIGAAVALLLVAWIGWSLLTGGGPGPSEAVGGDGVEIVDPLTGEGGPVIIDQGSAGGTVAVPPARERVVATRPEPRTESPTGPRAPSAERVGSGDGLLGGALRGGDGAGSAAGGGDPMPAAPRVSAARAAEIDAQVRAAVLEARTRLQENDPLGARATLNAALREVGRDGPGAGALRAELMGLNDELVFGPRVVDGDPMSTMYVVRSGDALSRIASRLGNGTHWKLIQRANRLSSPNTIRVGQSLKVLQGPFHAVVDRSDYRLDMYHGAAESPESWVYVTSMPVGLGEDGSTPSGRFIVRSSGKLENPAWVNPRNPSERYTGNDPENPIGEFWVGIEGLGDDAVHTGLGLHGTIEPETIGTQASMGCVRLGAEDVALVYELLSEGESLVTIVD